MGFLVVVGGLQFVYCVVVGNYVCFWSSLPFYVCCPLVGEREGGAGGGEEVKRRRRGEVMIDGDGWMDERKGVGEGLDDADMLTFDGD